MKLLQYLLFIIVVVGCMNSSNLTQEILKKGDTKSNQEKAYIIAKSGLKLRTAPTLNSNVIETGNYWQIVQILEKNVSAAQKIEEKTGTWFRVKLNNKEGYMFSGFLTKPWITEQEKKRNALIHLSKLTEADSMILAQQMERIIVIDTPITQERLRDIVISRNKTAIAPLVILPKHRINYIKESKSIFFINRIQFKDRKESILSTYDVKVNNPYNFFDLHSDGYNAFGGKIYNLKDLPKKSFQQLFKNSTSRSSSKINSIDFITADSETVVYQKSENYALIAYNLRLYDWNGQTYESQSEVVILDSLGKLIQKFQLPHITRAPLLTDNGKYFFANFGGAYDCSEFEYIEQGFKVYEVVSGELIYEEYREDTTNLQPATHFNVFSFPIKLGNGFRINKIYDFDKQLLYEREFSRSDLGYSTYVKDGIKVKDKSGSFIVLNYEQDFNKTNLTLKK